MAEHQSTPNALINESSPYLLQHAYNPVQWMPWSDDTLDKARQENKVILLSIGYSACHWCHVMERECFEDLEVAQRQNDYFINIKVDREERPDVDQVYMDAVQAMGMRGGWPLNVFLLPDGRPFYGGTYFPKHNWIQVLDGVHQAFAHDYDKVAESAQQLTDALQRSEIEKYRIGTQTDSPAYQEVVNKGIETLHKAFDPVKGGFGGAPKFPMPCIYGYLLRAGYFTGSVQAHQMVERTLDAMALGGIYDHAGGGFARYSVDDEWFIPHFEKMLYDNAQLLGLYAEAYQVTKKPLYADTIRQTVAWLNREMLNTQGAFYAALDADSEGVEGKYYSYTWEELSRVWGEQTQLLAHYYRCSEAGNWEHGVNVLFPVKEPTAFADSMGIDTEAFLALIKQAMEALRIYRDQRVRPGLDSKILCGWNALLVSGLCKAGMALNDTSYIKQAEACMDYLLTHLRAQDLSLYRCIRATDAPIPAFAEDYAAVLVALADLYAATFDVRSMHHALAVYEVYHDRFFDADEGYFLSSPKGHWLIANKKEIFDNVIPSPNALTAEALYRIGRLMDRRDMVSLAETMVAGVLHLIEAEPRYMAQWASTLSAMAFHHAELVVAPAKDEKDSVLQELQRLFIPGFLMAIGEEGREVVTIAQNKTAGQGKTTYYVCEQGSCQAPVHTLAEALGLMHNT